MQILRKKLSRIIAMIVVFCLAGCGSNDTIQKNKVDWNQTEYIYDITQYDQNIYYDGMEIIDLAAIESNCYLNKEGVYVLTGSTSNAVIVDAEDQNVHILLYNANINVEKGPAIYIKSSGKTVITIGEDTVNSISDGAYDSTVLDGNAAIYSESDLTINGNGELDLYSYRDYAIKTKDMLKILGGNIDIQAKKSAVRGNDGILIAGGVLKIESENDSFITTKKKKNNKGSIEIYNTQISVIAGGYGLNSASNIYVKDCSMNLSCVLGNTKYKGEVYIQEGCID